ncbi:MAG: hypothetical protein RLZZ214_2588 [Verrucomicrobiota bacterium]|jgi:hypothetical protein
MTMPAEDVIARITGFLDEIGIPWTSTTLGEGEFLPGVRIENGVLQFDRDALLWPGDLLHEAGHIAVTAPSQRAALGGKLDVTPADEMAALAWSYAAAIGCGIDPAIVFHEGGYKSGGAQLIAQYATGFGAGVPMLQWYRMSPNFPSMISWLRVVEDPTAPTSQP